MPTADSDRAQRQSMKPPRTRGLACAYLVGQRFGRLVVVRFHHKTEKGNVYWECRCDCGNTKAVALSCLSKNSKFNGTRSCGCLRREYRKPRLDPGVAAFNSVVHLYKRGASKRGLSFELSGAQALELFSADCFYCGSAPSNVHRYLAGSFVYNGIDRLDNSRGYTVDNCVPCCAICNKAKNALGYQEFVAWLRKAGAHQARKAADVQHRITCSEQFYLPFMPPRRTLQ